MKPEFPCPLCSVTMKPIRGTQMDPRDGVTLWCDNKSCPSNESVYGHGPNENSAYVTACQKFKVKRRSD